MMGPERETAIDRIFGPLLPERACGDCTVCCTVPAIPELQKAADSPCVHCVKAGCAIYDRRPAACEAFFCGWRRLADLPDDLRPDRCGVVVMLEVDAAAANPFDRICYVARWRDDETPADGQLIERLRDLLGRGFIPLFFSPARSTRKSLVHPAPEIYNAIVNDARVTGKAKDKVKRWRTMLARGLREAKPDKLRFAGTRTDG
jgi:hypothetical protein